MELCEYPRPPDDTGIGIHWFPDAHHYGPDELATFAPELSSLGISWLATVSDLDQVVPEHFLQGLQQLGIEPIVRICPPHIHFLDLVRLREVCHQYASYGVHYIHVYCNPNMSESWSKWDPRALPERFITYLLPCLEAIHDTADLVPLFTPLVAGGDYPDLRFLSWCLDTIARLGHEYLFDRMAIGIQNYAFNKPLDWGEGGPERWPDTEPHYTPDGCEDHIGFRLFEWYDALVRRHVGKSLPLIACESGVLMGDAEHPDLPEVDAGLHARRTVQMCRMMAEGALPDYLFNTCFWLMATELDHPAVANRWYTARGERALPMTVEAVQDVAATQRPQGKPWPREIAVLTTTPGPGEPASGVLDPEGAGEAHVVTMDIEEYLKGVLPMELGTEAPEEALRAMAVAARGYAMAAVLSTRHGEQAAVCDTAHCQVWSPMHHPATDRAVEDTRGIVPTYDGAPVATYHFAHCDGHTRNSEDVWRRALPYCRSVPCECGRKSLHGHGVGLCQDGAVAMAKKGVAWPEILRHYYLGISLRALRSVRGHVALPVADATTWRMDVAPSTTPHTIAGCLPYPGVAILVSDEWGLSMQTFSGASPEHGEGGFEVGLWGAGRYTISFLDAAFQLNIDSGGTFLTFGR